MASFVVNYKINKPSVKGDITRISRVDGVTSDSEAAEAIRERAKREGWTNVRIVRTKKASVDR